MTSHIALQVRVIELDVNGAETGCLSEHTECYSDEHVRQRMDDLLRCAYNAFNNARNHFLESQDTL
jgi:hypothetical protein